MPNIASALKSEIARIARKEVRAEIEALRKSAASQRKDIASLKQRAQSLDRLLRERSRAEPSMPTAGKGESPSAQRFSAKGLIAHRKRLDLSAAEVGLLLGTSSQTVYNWEQGKSRPRAGHLPAIAALRTLGKKQAAAVVAVRVGSSQEPAPT